MKDYFSCTVKSPTRIDLSGGLLDIWPLYTIIEDCCTVNCSIPVFTSVRFNNRPALVRFMAGACAGSTGESCYSKSELHQKDPDLSNRHSIKVKVSSLSGCFEKSFFNLRDLLQDPAKELLLLKKHIEYWSKKEKTSFQEKEDLRLRNFKAESKTQEYDDFCVAEKAELDRDKAPAGVKNFVEGEIYLHSESPVGAGIGASSSLCVSLAKAFAFTMGYTLNRTGLECDKDLKGLPLGRKPSKHLSQNELLLICRDLETALLRAPAGVQDYVPALDADPYSLYIIEYSPFGPQWKKKKLPLEFFKDHLLLVDTGKSHHSGQNNWGILKKAVDRDPKTLKALYKLRDNSLETRKVCEEENWPDLFSCLKKEQELRARFFPGWLNPAVSSVMALITEQGEPAVKLCGAGGGGCLVLLTKNKKQKKDLQNVCAKNNIPIIKI